MLTAVLTMAAFFGQPAFEEPDPIETARRADQLLDVANRRPEVARFCRNNPSAVLTVEVGAVTIALHCRAWHAWLEEQKPEPDTKQ